jgi:hypothetical protein
MRGSTHNINGGSTTCNPFEYGGEMKGEGSLSGRSGSFVFKYELCYYSVS